MAAAGEYVMRQLFNRSMVIAATYAALTLVGSTALYAQAQYRTPAQIEYDQRKQRDSDNAERLHILFSNIPGDYCRTAAVVRAEAILKEELALIDREIEYYQYTVTVDEHKTATRAVPGKQDDVDSLNRIRKRLFREYVFLTAYPACVTGYNTVFANGLFIGLHVVKTDGHTVFVERFIPTDRITNEFRDSQDPLGVGFSIAYAFSPFNNNVVVSPFVSFDYLNAPVNHHFAGGSYLGSTANVAGTAGIKFGPSVTRDFWLYGIAGVSVLNETLNVNFLPATSSIDKTVAGATLGAGFAFKPGFLQNFGRPVSVFAEYQHTWWQTAQFNSPAASPGFNYSFRRQDDVVKLGFNVHFNDPPTPAPLPAAMPVMAPTLK
jgi:hypothetical protein